MKRQKKKSKSSDWEYCECGCHGHVLKLGTLSYWLFNDLSGGKSFHLYRGHGGMGEHLGDFLSFEKADQATRKNAKPIIRKLLKELSNASATI